MAISWRHIPGSESAGVSVDGYDEAGCVAVRVVRHTNGWRAYLRGDDTDRVDYSEMEAAMRAAEAAHAAAPAPARSVRGERFGRRLPNRPQQGWQEGERRVRNEPG